QEIMGWMMVVMENYGISDREFRMGHKTAEMTRNMIAHMIQELLTCVHYSGGSRSFCKEDAFQQCTSSNNILVTSSESREKQSSKLILLRLREILQKQLNVDQSIIVHLKKFLK
ncbi:hypothetical protein KIN20_030734, partial [Parelaphostrongylus tenuis]